MSDADCTPGREPRSLPLVASLLLESNEREFCLGGV